MNHLPPLREIIETYNLRADKSLGQNFLLDLNITDKIVRMVKGDLSKIHAIEIGPGPGGLTRSLLSAGIGKVTAIEYDPRAVRALHPLAEVYDDKIDILEQDALRFNFKELLHKNKCTYDQQIIISNLPYNIATPLLTGWLKIIATGEQHIDQMVLMFQKEVGDRITAETSTKAYGRLSVLAQWLCQTSKCFDLPPEVFSPPPKITSSVLHFQPKEQQGFNTEFFDTLEKITAQAFGQRRKMIRSTLKAYSEYFDDLNLKETDRAENLSPDDFVALAQCVRS